MARILRVDTGRQQSPARIRPYIRSPYCNPFSSEVTLSSVKQVAQALGLLSALTLSTLSFSSAAASPSWVCQGNCGRPGLMGW